MLATLTESDLDRPSRHSALGPVTLRQFLNEYWAHDTMHLVQAERALMQAFIPETGPWRSYFADHDVALKGEGAVGRPLRRTVVAIRTRVAR